MARTLYYWKNYFHIVKNYGVMDGVKVCWGHLLKRSALYIAPINEYLSMRPGSSDFDVFLQVFLNGEYDMKLKDIHTIVDAGANNGFTARYFEHVYPEAKIISIEPDPDNFKVLEQNVQSRHNIIPVFGALVGGKVKTTVTLGSGKGWCRQVDMAPGSIPAFPLGMLITEHNITSIDLLKIDIEGAELDVFSRNAGEWLPVVKTIVIELHDRWVKGSAMAFFKAMDNYSYDLEVKGENVILRNIAKNQRF